MASVLTLPTQRPAGGAHLHVALHQKLTGQRSLQDDGSVAAGQLLHDDPLAHGIALQVQEQFDHLGGAAHAAGLLVIQRVAAQQGLLLNGDLVAKVRLDHHRRVRHPGLLGALDDLEPRALHQDGVPEDGEHRVAQLLQ